MNLSIDITGVVLRTPRLTLRPWRQSDLADFYEYASVDGVGQMAGWLPHENMEKSQMILDSFISHKKVFALEYEGKVIGSLGVEEYDETRFPEFAEKKVRELGFVLSKAYWGMGLMPEACREVIRWLFADMGADLLLCGHFTRNAQSARVQQKVGFHPYAQGNYTTRMDTVELETVNILTREEWEGIPRIRPAKPEDYDAVSAILAQAQQLHVERRPDIYRPCDPVLPEEAFLECLERGEIIAAELQGKVVGMLEYIHRHVEAPTMHPRHVLYVEAMVVDEPYRGRGIGRHLFSWLETEARRCGCPAVELQVNARNPEAMAVYRACGFREKSINMELVL